MSNAANNKLTLISSQLLFSHGFYSAMASVSVSVSPLDVSWLPSILFSAVSAAKCSESKLPKIV